MTTAGDDIVGCRGTLQALADDIAAGHHCPTVSWGVVADGELVLHSGTPHTVYRIASMTKSFTSAAVLALRDEGVLGLDDPVARHAPELGAVAGPPGSPAITVRHLLSMSSGLATDDAWADCHLDISPAEIDRVYSGGSAFAHLVGTTYEYSNLGFAMLGRVVERVSGVRVQEHVAERFLKPLGLARTTWLKPTTGDWARPHRVRQGTTVEADAEPLGDGELAPMGGLWSTVADLARWVAWLDEATTRPAATDWVGLSPSSRREMQKVHTFIGVTSVAGRTCPAGYGFGLNLRADPELGTIVAHAGGLPGYGSNMRWFGGRGIGVIALANSTYAPMSVLTMQMLTALHQVNVVPPPAAPEAPHFTEACHRLVALLNCWSDRAAEELFADNVALDEPLADRRAAAEYLLATHGTLTVTAVEPTSATSGTVLVQGRDRPLRITVELAPLADAPVQFYSVDGQSHAG